MTETTVYVTLAHVNCCQCRATFGITREAKDDLRRTHKLFWCPYCHTGQLFSHESDIAQAERRAREARDALIAERSRHDQTRAELKSTERKRRAVKGQLMKVKNRVSKGVCPCCNRHFENLERHMATKHADYASTGETE